MQANLSTTYARIGRHEQALQMDRDVYLGHLKLQGEEHPLTLISANNYASSLVDLQRFEEAKTLLRKVMPVAWRVLGKSNDLTFRMRLGYAMALYKDSRATLDDFRESVTTLEDSERTARRVLGGAQPFVAEVELALKESRAALGDAVAIDDLREAMSAMSRVETRQGLPDACPAARTLS